MKRTSIFAIGLAVLVTAPALAQPAPHYVPTDPIVDNSLGSTDPRAAPMPMPGPQRHMSDGYEIVSGGVTGEERTALDAAERSKSVKLVLAATNGDYLADAAITVSDAHGREVARTDDAIGPYVYIALPPGTYTVTATLSGEMRTQKVTAGPGQHRYTLRFRSQ